MNPGFISEENYPRVAQIYQEGISTGKATFEKAVPDWASWDQAHLQDARITAERDNQIIGWAALSPVSSRCVYGGVAEVSVYVAATARGAGVGKFLLDKLISLSENTGIWTLQSGVFRENIASIRLHEKCGFRVIGYRERIGQLDGVWKDNILLERRSNKIGL